MWAIIKTLLTFPGLTENDQFFCGLSQHWITIKAEIEALVALNLPNDVLCL